MGTPGLEQSRLTGSGPRILAKGGAESGAPRDAEALAAFLAALDPDDLADALNRLPAHARRRIVDALTLDRRARV